MNMSNNGIPFAQPFTLKMQCGLEHTFINAYDALDFLENEWPLRTGTSYAHAVAVLGDVLAGRRASRAARSALISACHEAGLTPVIVELSGNGSRPNAA